MFCQFSERGQLAKWLTRDANHLSTPCVSCASSRQWVQLLQVITPIGNASSTQRTTPSSKNQPKLNPKDQAKRKFLNDKAKLKAASQAQPLAKLKPNSSARKPQDQAKLQPTPPASTAPPAGVQPPLPAAQPSSIAQFGTRSATQQGEWGGGGGERGETGTKGKIAGQK